MRRANGGTASYARVVTFHPIRTERLVVRSFTLDDVDALHRWRSHPDVARYQNWERPFPREEAARMVTELVAMDGPENDEWWMAAIELDGEAIGDLALHLEWQGRSAEVGYNLHPDHWGKGYAVEALDALVSHLFDDLGVTRVFGMLHPDNRASAQVLERVGMLFEGHTRSSYWDGDEVSDDWIYGMTVEDRDPWRDRPRHRPAEVRLVEVTGANFNEVYFLRTHKSQESFVAPMPKSLSQALLAPTDPEEPVEAWYRAIEADGQIVGFVMVALALDGSDDEPFLWRLLIDRLHQRRGVGSMALTVVEDEMRGRGFDGWLTSWVPGRGSPEPFYVGFGFEPTGEMEGTEVIARRSLRG